MEPWTKQGDLYVNTVAVRRKSDHRTVLTGEVYGRTSGMTITLDDAWEDDGMAF